MERELLIVYVKNPVPGKVKSRLAATIGKDAACDIYQQLLHRIRTTVSTLSRPVRISFFEDMGGDNFWAGNEFQKIQQVNGDLGTRMTEDFRKAFEEGYDKVVIIGSDIPDLSVEIINEAFNSLNSNDSVIGPSEDGGYYLIGFNSDTSYQDCFKNISWSTDKVFAETVMCYRKGEIKYTKLRILKDVDYEEDIPQEFTLPDSLRS